ncbi:MAG: 4Fe-4S dicluster domain-containing protein [Bacteroidales bacterium]|nr:4Fe-4S dicluster domain-containing protein [Bacteroidales bacterium]
MIKQIVFLVALLITLGVFTFSIQRYFKYFKFTKRKPLKNIGKRLWNTLDVAGFQVKIFRRPVIGLVHALVFWGFMIILFGSIEMVVDGLSGHEKVFSVLGVVYSSLMAFGDVFALIILVAMIIFLARRLILHVKRFSGVEMKPVSEYDAVLALTIIFVLMVSLLGMNTFYLKWAALTGTQVEGLYPISHYLVGLFSSMTVEQAWMWYQINWWTHILLIFIFANILPYSKHFHVFMSVPNVFVSKVEPLGYIENMDNITKEVKVMLDPNATFDENTEEETVERFGALDVDDLNWVNYFNSLACTECGRCTSVCPANITGKLLSPRKVMMNTRARMKEKGPGLVKEGKEFDDGKHLVMDYLTEEELWACTMCNACAQECPININQPSIILEARRYLVMEESKAPAELNTMFANIENNGAPWQFAQDDRMLWAEGLEVPLMADKFANNEKPEYLFWVGSAGAIDDRYKKVIREFVKILNYLKVDYAVLGTEESDSGDVARRAGNEMLYQMQAMTNIEVMNGYEVNKIVTCDPHDFNTMKNEYCDLGGNYEVQHHTQFLQKAIDEGKLTINSDKFAGQKITYHDPCYLGRGNGEYDAPRDILKAIPSVKVEMEKNRSFAMCCGAGGGQMFKEAEKGDKEVFIERTEQALETGASIICTSCPFCMTMMTDGIKYKNKEEEVKNYDIAELVSISLGL